MPFPRRFTWAVLPLLTACSGVTVHTDFDRSANFAQYKTYSWAKVPTDLKNPLMASRIVSEVDGQLYAKGWRKVDPGQGDAALASHVTAREQEQINTMYDNMGPGWYGYGYGGFARGRWGYGGPGMATSTVTTYTIGTLVVDVFDSKTKQAIWHGTAEGTVSDDPQSNEKNVSEGIAKMFQEFPPGLVASKP